MVKTTVQSELHAAASTATGYLLKAAQLGNSEAFFLLAEVEESRGDRNKALQYLQRGSMEGCPESQFAFGRMLLDEYESYDDGVAQLYEAALQGHREADDHLARVFYRYDEAPADAAKAYRWFLSISESASFFSMEFAIEAKYHVARLCFDGIGTQLDPKRAVDLFREVCLHYMDSDSKLKKQLAVEAAYFLGVALSSGKGVEQSWEQAVEYWEKVRALG